MKKQHKQRTGATLENKEFLGKNRLNPEAPSDENNLDLDTHERGPSGESHAKGLGAFLPHPSATSGPHRQQELSFAQEPMTLQSAKCNGEKVPEIQIALSLLLLALLLDLILSPTCLILIN